MRRTAGRTGPRRPAGTCPGLARSGLSLLVLAALFGRCGRDRPSGPEPAEPAPPPAAAAVSDREAGPTRGATQAQLRNVDLRVLPRAVLRVRYLSGEVRSTRRGEPVALDDKTSYDIRVRSGQASIGYADLSRILNDYTFAFEGAPVKGLEVAREEDEDERDEIQLTGKLKKALGIPFEIEGRPEVEPDGRIRIRTTSIQALDIKVGGLLHALGLEPKDLLGNLERRGLSVDGNDLILDPSRALPPPRVEGQVTSVQVEDGGLGLTFGEAPQAGAAGAREGNFLWFRKGTIRIGKMTQTDADLRIVDRDPKDPFDFYGDRMTRQLVAGYARLNAAGGLTMFVPDYGDIGQEGARP